MGVKIVCDCGQEKIGNLEDFEKIGVDNKLYCRGECADKVHKFLEERDELHDKVKAVWDVGIEELKEKYAGFEVPGGP
jgi:hypothetical protein